MLIAHRAGRRSTPCGRNNKKIIINTVRDLFLEAITSYAQYLYSPFCLDDGQAFVHSSYKAESSLHITVDKDYILVVCFRCEGIRTRTCPKSTDNKATIVD